MRTLHRFSPLAIATASDEGYARVATAIRAHAAAPVTP